MTLVAAAVVPTPPLLVPEVAGGSAPLTADLLAACDAAVADLLRTGPDVVVVVGAAPVTGPTSGHWDWRGFGVLAPATAPDPVTARLPLALAIGAWLLDRASTHSAVGTSTGTPAVELVGVASDLGADDCRDLGRDLVADRRVALLVCGDGSACRDLKAPGHLDPRAEDFDARATAALATVDPAAILAIDRAVGAELLASGPGPWQVLAGAAGDAAAASYDGVVTWDGAPYGVGYVVATWLPRSAV